MAEGGPRGNVGDFSGVLKKEVTNPRKDTPFVVLISLLTTLAIARAFVLLTGAANTTTETSSYIGRNLIIGGYHIHHFFYGFARPGVRGAFVPVDRSAHGTHGSHLGPPTRPAC